MMCFMHIGAVCKQALHLNAVDRKEDPPCRGWPPSPAGCASGMVPSAWMPASGDANAAQRCCNLSIYDPEPTCGTTYDLQVSMVQATAGEVPMLVHHQTRMRFIINVLQAVSRSTVRQLHTCGQVPRPHKFSTSQKMNVWMLSSCRTGVDGESATSTNPAAKSADTVGAKPRSMSLLSTHHHELRMSPQKSAAPSQRSCRGTC